MKKLDVLIKAIIGGLCISIGGCAFLCTEDKTVGTILFTVGLFVICTFGFNLYTGKVAYIFDNKLSYLIDVLIIWFGNLIGTYLGANLMLLTRQGDAMRQKAISMCDVKFADSFLSMFILGIFCNFLIFIAVDGFKNNNHELGKYLSLLFGVVTFIFCGFEHSIADMFYISVAGKWSASALIMIIVVSLGNAIGGVIVPLYRKYSSKM